MTQFLAFVSLVTACIVALLVAIVVVLRLVFPGDQEALRGWFVRNCADLPAHEREEMRRIIEGGGE